MGKPASGAIATAARGGIALIAVAAAGALLLQAWYLGWVAYYSVHDPESTAFMELRKRQGGPVRQRWTPYDAIAPSAKRAVVAAEDAQFVAHHGFDWGALRRALRANLAADRVVQGGSTISQQLAKNLFLSPRRSVWRKGQEALITVMLEAMLSKRRILALYLNVIEWGDGIFGIWMAAQRFSDRPPQALDRWQAARLAARIPRPRFYDRHGPTDYLYQRAGDIADWAVHTRIP